jgi:putative transposase
VSPLEVLLDSFQIERPDIVETPQHLCLDKGYSGEPALEIVVLRGFIPHIKSRGQEKIEKQTHPDSRARRWVVEAAHSWMNRFRKIPVHFENIGEFIPWLAYACVRLHRLPQSPCYLRTNSN